VTDKHGDERPDERAQCERDSKLLAEYERAQETAHHCDVIIYEVAAIIWSGNTLLLGFILEAPYRLGIQIIVAVLSILGMMTSAFVTRTLRLSKIIQHVAYQVCQKIENDIPLANKLHSQVNAIYPPRVAQRWVWAITIAFLIVWLVVFTHAGMLIWKLRCSS